jgi:hypothetical protein
MICSGSSVYNACVASSSVSKSDVLVLSGANSESRSGAIAIYHSAAISSAI